MPEYFLSVSCGHDSSAALLRDGIPVVAIAQERLDRIKHSDATGKSLTGHYINLQNGFPWAAIHYCLETENIGLDQIDIFTTNFVGEIPQIGRQRVPFPNHHICHAASAFYGSGFERSAILVADYGGDTLILNGQGFIGHERQSAWVGDTEGITLVWRQSGNNNANLFGLGCLYSELASYLFAGHDSEGKLMALSAYGRESPDFPYSFFEIYEDRVYLKSNNLLRESQNRPVGMPEDMPHFEAELNWEAFPPSPIQYGEITQFHRNLTYRIQKDLEEALLYLACELWKITTSPNLCISGGIALNCVANARILEEAGFENVFICPAPGDSGQSLGAALRIWYSNHPPLKERLLFNHTGRKYHDQEILATLRKAGDKITFYHYDNIAQETAQRLAKGEIVAWFQGRSEFGPRALGARSILADPRSKETIQRLNDEVKKRQWFQPIAPSIIAERALEYFTIADSPFMSFAAKAKENTRRLAPGIVHKDGTSRIHTVEAAENPIYHRLICEFEKLAGIPIIANTSFNAKGEPIVESPQDALNALYRMSFDSLVIGPFMIMRAGNIVS